MMKYGKHSAMMGLSIMASVWAAWPELTQAQAVSTQPPPVNTAVLAQTESGDANVTPSDADDGVLKTAQWGGFLLAESTRRRIDTSINPENIARVPQATHELAMLLEYRLGNFFARLRASDRYHNILTSELNDSRPRPRRYSLALTQLAWRQPLINSWTLSIGQMNLSLDDGQSMHPLDFFDDSMRGSDFDDNAGRSRGFPLVMLEKNSPTQSIRCIFSDDRKTDKDFIYGDPNPNFNRGYKQAVLAVRRSIDQVTVGGVLQRAWPGHHGFGSSVSWVAAPSLSLYGASFSSVGNPLPLHKDVHAALNPPFGRRAIHTLVDSPIGAWAQDDDRLYHRWLLGLNWSFESGDTLVAELWKDGRGMSRKQFDTWRNLVEFHDQLKFPLSRVVNLGYDLESLLTRSGPHLFLHYTTTLPREIGVLHLTNTLAQDGSGTAGLRLDHQLSSNFSLRTDLWQRYGGRRSRFGAIPDKSGLTLQLLRPF